MNANGHCHLTGLDATQQSGHLGGRSVTSRRVTQLDRKSGKKNKTQSPSYLYHHLRIHQLTRRKYLKFLKLPRRTERQQHGDRSEDQTVERGRR